MKVEKDTIKLTFPITVTKKRNHYVSYCKTFDVFSQGKSKLEAKRNIEEAVRLFIETLAKTEKRVVNALPAFPRTLRGEKPTAEELDRLIELIRRNERKTTRSNP